jgi:aspartate racemase
MTAPAGGRAPGVAMRAIGLLGGMSWESTAIYYRLLNERVRERLGGLHSARIIMESVDFAEIEALQRAARWDDAGARLAAAARRLEAAGAECLLICANTMHKVAPAVGEAIGVPLIHIVDATAAALRAHGSRRPLLLATRYVMEQDFYKGRLATRFGIEPIVPEEADRAAVHAVIFDELCRGIVRPDSKARYLAIAARAQGEGADGIIFGCTEIGMLLSQADFAVPVFDSAAVHADAAVDFALAA